MILASGIPLKVTALHDSSNMTITFGHSEGVASVNIPAGRFKAECLELMDRVAKTREAIVITKHGRPVAQLAPIAADSRSLFGYMKGSIKSEGNLTDALDENWSALSGDEDRLYSSPVRRPARKK
jgi:prevent-host-death family protein